MPTPSLPIAVRPSDPGEVAAAYERIKPEFEAIPQQLVGRVTTDVPTAVSLYLGAQPQLEALVPEMKRLLKEPPLAEIARLRDRALGLLYTHLRFVPASSTNLNTDLEEARVLRAQMLTAADAHVVFGQMNPDAVAKIREGAGHLDRANDLIALSGLFRGGWSVVGAKTQVTVAQLERASVLGTLLVAQLGSKELGVGPANGPMSWTSQRNRAFRLFMFDYDEIRRAVEYVRYHEEDATSYLPTLHRRRSASKTGTEADGVLEEAPDAGDITDVTDTE